MFCLWKRRSKQDGPDLQTWLPERLKRIKGNNKSWKSMATEGRLGYWMRETREQNLRCGNDYNQIPSPLAPTEHTEHVRKHHVRDR